jgi:hypothetical protein
VSITWISLPREQRPHTFDRAVEAIGEDPPDPIRRLVLERGALKLLIGPSESEATIDGKVLASYMLK